MSNKNLFKEAIADAKAVREAALANAKAALEEALTPKLQSMLAAKLNEMDYDMEEEGMKSDDEMEEGMYPEDTSDEIQDRYRATGAALEEDELEEDFDLSEILAELNDEEELKEAKEEKEEKEEAGEEAEDESEEEEATEEEPTEEEGEEEVEVKDMTIEDLKDLIKDIVSQEIETETPADEEIAPVDAMYGEMGPDVNAEEDEINLEELLAELDSLNEAKEKLDEIEPISLTLGITAAVGAALAKYLKNDAMKVAASKLGKQVNELTPEEKKAAEQAVAKAVSNAGRDFGSGAGKSLSVDEAKEEMEEGVFSDLGNKLSAWAYDTNLDNIKACKDATKGKGIAEFQKCLKSKGVKMVTSTTTGIAENEDLAEAIETINTLRTELNETNLLNAKLLYVNKIFKAKNLTESQKLKVIASFDKATNVKEAKVVFESLQSALTAAPKKAIKESLGFASKAAGVAPNKTIVESNDVITRMQKLANIK
jgi:hypothetical protein